MAAENEVARIDVYREPGSRELALKRGGFRGQRKPAQGGEGSRQQRVVYSGLAEPGVFNRVCAAGWVRSEG